MALSLSSGKCTTRTAAHAARRNNLNKAKLAQTYVEERFRFRPGVRFKSLRTLFSRVLYLAYYPGRVVYNSVLGLATATADQRNLPTPAAAVT